MRTIWVLCVLAACGDDDGIGPDAPSVIDASAPITASDSRFKGIGAITDCPGGVSRERFEAPFDGTGELSAQENEADSSRPPQPWGSAYIDGSASLMAFVRYRCRSVSPTPGVSAGTQIGLNPAPESSVLVPRDELPGVITSLQFTPSRERYAVTWTTGATPDEFITDDVPLVVDQASDLRVVVPQLTGSGAVVTAIGYTASTVELYGYRRTGDPLTYDTMLQHGGIDLLAGDAARLALEGYFITAFGQDAGGNFAMIGTRPTGTTGSRELVTVTETDVANGTDSQEVQRMIEAGWVIVASVQRGSDVDWYLQR